MDDCIFCKIIKGEIPAEKVYEDDLALAFLDNTPINPGHTLIVPKQHFDNFLELPEDLMCALARVAKKIAPAVLAAVGAKDFNLGLNNGAAAGQAVNHFHWHLMPRLAGDGYELWHGRSYADGEAQLMAEKIRANLV
ncbi:MAG: HIT family protein [Patescibacteria group bacterium]